MNKQECSVSDVSFSLKSENSAHSICDKKTPEVSVKKYFFSLEMMLRTNKLECVVLTRLFSLV
jgi:hypothetical protein